MEQRPISPNAAQAQFAPQPAAPPDPAALPDPAAVPDPAAADKPTSNQQVPAIVRLLGSVGLRNGLLTLGELLVILIWALIVTAPYLNLDRDMIPMGRELPHHIHSNHLWGRVLECGTCAFWNGAVRGGYPALVDPQVSMLHPLVVATTLLFGVVNGAKLALVGAFLMAGLAQWWLARVVGVGRIAATWSGCIAVAGGHLAARMEHGIFSLVISAAACALVFAPLVLLVSTGQRRAVVLFGFTLALALLAGQGYLQIGLALLMPAALLMVPDWRPQHLARLVGRGLLGVLLAFLLAAPFLVPLAHFAPQFTKLGDSDFIAAQPLVFAPLNLVINDYDFFYSDILDKYPYPSIYVIFVGWIPVLLAFYALGGAWSRWGRGVVGFLLAAVVLAFWIGTATPLIWLAEAVPDLDDVVAGVRFIPLVTILAVPPLLGLAAIGLQRLLDLPWPRPRIPFSSGQRLTRRLPALDPRWLLALPLGLALTTAYDFGRPWIGIIEQPSYLYRDIEVLRTPDLQWVSIPYAAHFWVQPGISRGLKLSMGTQGWFWAGREWPMPERIAYYTSIGTGMTPYGEIPPGSELIHEVGELQIYDVPPGAEYAAVDHADGSRTVCTAHGTGGDIDVACSLPRAGVLTVKENSWPGWTASLAGGALPFAPGQWLRVEVPAGQHLVELRYRPWDAPLGLGLWLVGHLLAGYLWWRGDAE